MQYVTGMTAFGIECKRDSCGKWNLTKDDFTNNEKFTLRESDDMPYKDYGIEKDKIVPYREYCLYNVADHVRAYLDLLYECKFDLLTGLFDECIKDMKCRKDIFMTVYGKLRNLAIFKEVNEFMISEFGNAWLSYLDSVHSVAEHISKREDYLTELQKIQENL